jgi:hypothetical protein
MELFVRPLEDKRALLSTLWIAVLFNIVCADILSFISPGFFEELAAMKVDSTMLLVFAVLLEIPILMILLSRILVRKVNRPANILASIITILFVVGGGSASLHYIFFESVEVVLMIIIASIAWKWRTE